MSPLRVFLECLKCLPRVSPCIILVHCDETFTVINIFLVKIFTIGLLSSFPSLAGVLGHLTIL